jgi:hypothetical protein
MLRNVFIVLVLASFAATVSIASPVVPAKSHKRASASLSHHKPVRRTHAASSTRSRTQAAHAPASRSRSRRSISRSGSRTSPVRLAHLQRSKYIMPSPLRGSLESLTRQNERAEADGLERILDEDDLSNRIAQKLLIPVPASSGLIVNSSLSETHRYCRPWTANFLSDLSAAHTARWHKPVTVSSAVRTVEYQQQLMRTNGNAAAAEGDIVSPHLTGGTVDIVKQGMSRQELYWMRAWLLALQQSGTIDVEEEFRQRCFHITVYKDYIPPPTVPTRTPSRRRHPVSAGQIADRGK